MLLESSGLFDAIAGRLADGMPAFGTCRMILLGREILDGRPDQRSFGALGIAVQRNAFGQQVDSFEADLAVEEVDGPSVPRYSSRRRWSSGSTAASRCWPPCPAPRAGAGGPRDGGPRSIRSWATMRLHRPSSIGWSMMSGHSKWATIKHKKAANDEAGQAVRQAAPGRGGRPRGQRRSDSNPRCGPCSRRPVTTRSPSTRSSGRSSGARVRARGRHLRDHLRGLRPRRRGRSGRGLTDDTSRTGADIRSIFSKNGGSIAKAAP